MPLERAELTPHWFRCETFTHVCLCAIFASLNITDL